MIQSGYHSLQNIHLHPLPPLQPLAPPLPILRHLQANIHANSLALSAVPEQTIEQDQPNLYRSFYQEKCQALENRCKSQQEIIRILQEKNTALQQQLSRAQQQRWKKFDYSRLSNRGRSKSQRRVSAPIIEVKVPKKMLKSKDVVLQDKDVKTDRGVYDKDIQYYREQLREFNALKQQMRDFRIKKEEYLFNQPIISKEQSFQGQSSSSQYQRSPKVKEQQKYGKHEPIVSHFSPSPLETVKKQANSLDFELKQLKNEVMYKDLLLDKLRNEHERQSRHLKNHLRLSVEESHKVQQQTTLLLNAFKAQIIRLSQQLIRYKQCKHSDTSQREKSKQDSFNQEQFLQILGNRRKEQIIL